MALPYHVRKLSFAALLISSILWSSQSAGVVLAQSPVDSRRAALEQELANLEKEIEAQRVLVDQKKQQRVSLERDVAIINAGITKSKLSIKARDLSIERLNGDIKQKQKTIGKLSDKIDAEKNALADLVRKTNRIDSFSISEIVLANQNLSDFFSDLDAYDVIKSRLRDSYKTVEGDRTVTQSEKEALEDKKQEETDLRSLQLLERKRLEAQEKEKQTILTLSKGIESVYQTVLKGKEKNAAAIRTELFSLSGSAAIPFEKALALAKVAASRAGIRPALLLGIIAEESNLGENVGTGNWKVDMKSPRDTTPFMDICRRLGLNPDNMPVSKKAWYGWGGAMGPAQFIPSTWILYESKITALTGHATPNPWDAEDAFTASAILLSENGASAKTPKAERLAALRYLAGWGNATKPAYSFYGDDVMSLADKYQKEIDILGG